MSKLPVISGKECVKALTKSGFHVKRRKGSHIIMRRDNPFAQVTVPDHKTLDRGTLKAIIKGSGLTTEEFLRLL
ncbi:MAG: type II toxin-antitoxin system HicA family toxin [Candidatus Aenigmatarchaeota archaeon]|nr:type II toxin-antitoxin system HicA family toxin [Nanoarchaeota archaeon]